MSVQRDEKKMWAALDQFFLRVLGEKTGRAVMQESREQAAAFLAAAQEPSPWPSCKAPFYPGRRSIPC